MEFSRQEYWSGFPFPTPRDLPDPQIESIYLVSPALAGQVVWYSHHLKNFPQFVVIHTVKGFGIINKAEIDVFLELSCFFYDPPDISNMISRSSAFSETSLTILKFMVHILLKPVLDNFEHYFANRCDECNCVVI